MDMTFTIKYKAKVDGDALKGATFVSDGPDRCRRVTGDRTTFESIYVGRPARHRPCSDPAAGGHTASLTPRQRPDADLLEVHHVAGVVSLEADVPGGRAFRLAPGLVPRAVGRHVSAAQVSGSPHRPGPSAFAQA
jgi:hypothetical protein